MKRPVIMLGFGMVVVVGIYILYRFNLLPQMTYRAEDFHVETLESEMDFNGNGVDDYTDFLLGARKDAKNKPKYDGSYQATGFPPDNIGVCSDVIWRAFKHAGYNLRAMVDLDIERRPDAYPLIEKPDSRIDFRRVRNLHIFFQEYGVSCSLDIDEIQDWQPGDIVIFGKDKHIGIVSNLRNRDGQTYIIHNGGQPNREEDYLKRGTVTAHYRFDATLVDDDMLLEWTEDF